MPLEPLIRSDNFVLWRVRSELGADLWQRFLVFRGAVYAEADAAQGTSRASLRAKSGFDSHLSKSHAAWSDVIQSDWDHSSEIYLVVDPTSTNIVGMIRLVRNRNPPAYTNVLYLAQMERGNIRPHEVFAAVCEHFNFTTVRASKIKSDEGEAHIRKCGFTRDGQDWIWQRTR